jgi:5-methylcytosine-specific restriction endonuclease McrA
MTKKIDNLSTEFNKHNEKLNKKYQKVSKENQKNERLLNLISKVVPNIIFDGKKEEILYYKRVGDIFYLNNSKKNICLVCGKRRKTTAHHLVPRRAGCKNRILRELRIRICKECDKKVHPEHSWVPQAIKKRDKKIEELLEKLKILETPKAEIEVEIVEKSKKNDIQIYIEKVEGDSKHHIFDYYEVRDKLVRLFGEPKTDEEHKILHKRMKKCMDVIPVFIITKEKHSQYHKEIKSNRTIKAR